MYNLISVSISQSKMRQVCTQMNKIVKIDRKLSVKGVT